MWHLIIEGKGSDQGAKSAVKLEIDSTKYVQKMLFVACMIQVADAYGSYSGRN